MASRPLPPARHVSPPALLLVLLLALLASVALSPAPARAAEDEARLWLMGTGTVALPADFEASLLLQTRFSDDIDDFERLLVNPWIARSLGHGFAAALGYDAHVIRYPRVRLEHRTWQQLAFQHPLLFARIDHRARLEERYLEGEDGTAMRLRYLLGASAAIADTRWRAVLRNEAFFNLNTKAGGPRESGFGETRLFVGVDRALGERAGIEIGYQLQYVDRRDPELAAHTLWIALRFGP